MSTITEDYISFETAKLLKEKWFKFIEDKDELSKAYIHAYTKEGKEVWGCYSPDYYPCITMNMAMKWLREVHNIHIVVHPYTDKEGHHFSFLFDSYAYGCWQELGVYITDSWSTYEEACEAAIKYCLEKLI